MPARPGWPPAAPADPPSSTPSARDWPAGCAGYAVNLVRPVQAGHRAAILTAILGQTLVFESLASASAYREAVCGLLRAPCGDLVTLDGGRITARGIVSGATFAVVPPARAAWRFGGIPADQRGALVGGGGAAPPALRAPAADPGAAVLSSSPGTLTTLT